MENFFITAQTNKKQKHVLILRRVGYDVTNCKRKTSRIPVVFYPKREIRDCNYFSRSLFTWQKEI